MVRFDPSRLFQDIQKTSQKLSGLLVCLVLYGTDVVLVSSFWMQKSWNSLDALSESLSHMMLLHDLSTFDLSPKICLNVLVPYMGALLVQFGKAVAKSLRHLLPRCACQGWVNVTMVTTKPSFNKQDLDHPIGMLVKYLLGGLRQFAEG